MRPISAPVVLSVAHSIKVEQIRIVDTGKTLVFIST